MVAALKVLRALGAAALALVLAGPVQAQTGRAAADSVQAGDIRLDPLPAQELAPGRCGIFLWANGVQQPLLVLAVLSNPSEAIIRANGRERSMRRTAFGGETKFGHFERQSFANDDFTVTVEVTYDQGRLMNDGAIIQQGRLRIVAKTGWETIVPVGGAVACPT